MSRILILEDDTSLALEIELALTEISGLIIDSAKSVDEGEHLMKLHRPDVIVSDVFLDDDENALEWIAQASYSIPVIVITGSTEKENYSLSKDINASCFLMKPINTDTLKYQVEKILDTLKSESCVLMIRDAGKLTGASVDDIIWIRTEGNYTTLKTEQKKYVVKRSLAKVGLELSSPFIIRVHRSAIINIKKVLNANLRGESIEMTDNALIPLGKKYKADYIKIMRDYYNTI